MKTDVKMLFATIFVLLISSPDYLDAFIKAIGYGWIFVCLLDCLGWSIQKLRNKKEQVFSQKPSDFAKNE